MPRSPVFVKFLIFTAYLAISFGGTWADKIKAPVWATTEPYGSEQKTVIQFYFHEIVTGDSATIQLIAQAQPSSPNYTTPNFGELYLVDNPLTIGPELNSTLVGRAQGFYGLASQTIWSYMIGLTYNFADGIYNGSSLSILGINTLTNPIREYPVVAGTGVFRMARGYVLAQTYFFSPGFTVIVGYNVTVFHPRGS